MAECKETGGERIDESVEHKNDADEKPDFQFERMVHKGEAMFKCEIDDIKRMETREDDIWVCSFSRSGTTMTQEMTYLVQTLDFKTARTVYLDDRFPLLELKDDRFPFYRGVKYADQMKSPRMIKSHLHHFLLPIQLQEGKGRIIYIARNPKDIATSFFRLMKWLGGLKDDENTFENFVDAFVNGTGKFHCTSIMTFLAHVLILTKKSYTFLEEAHEP
ncbi:sulfotransferase 4A1-like [Ruditapes philippinarum]|uniref:sulfotransferase 4A1-like n=1 Tax=Ruditapes philippinarum TaxID=129788 RepID=UPI00295A89DF|nr:sulfotransferase 4A1-like [Ruditapes philippinarum]